MKVYRISKCEYIEDLEGTGAARYPRTMEQQRHLYSLYSRYSFTGTPGKCRAYLQYRHQLLLHDLPGYSGGKIKTIVSSELPANWFNNPPIDVLKQIGDSFIKENKFLALKIPSAIMPEENNYLLNPAHPDFKKVSTVYVRNIPIDERFLKR